MRHGDHVKLVKDYEGVDVKTSGTPVRVPAGAHGVVCDGTHGGRLGPDLREGWLLVVIDSDTGPIHVDVRPEDVEPVPTPHDEEGRAA